ncbi:MAG: aspartate aminotransferase family protein [Candidatus Limnocylindrales bacterium]
MAADELITRRSAPEATAPGRVFPRVLTRSLPVAVRAQGAEIWDASGKRYLDAAGGAIVVNVGHGRESVARVMADQAARIAYAHGSAFTSEPLEAYAAEVGLLLPLDEPAIYPVSGGSEAIESALKMARAYHVARGEPDRQIVIGRWGSYHGNTLGALDLSGRQPLRRPYEGWLGRFRHVSAAYPYRAGDPEAHSAGTAEDAASELERVIETAGPTNVCAFVAEPIVGATLGVVAPPAGYWPAIAEVCRRHGVLLIADEVMTGFGRTGRWFAMERFGVRPDIVAAAKGATGGYWPFGFAAADRSVYETIQRKGVFVHGFTYSHSVVGAAVAREVLRILRAEALVAASERQGALLLAKLQEAFAGHPCVGEVRGFGLMAAVELVADRDTRAPFPRGRQVAERALAAGRERGVLFYSGTGNANGIDGDIVMVGPPFVVTDEQVAEIAAAMRAAVDAAVAS